MERQERRSTGLVCEGCSKCCQSIMFKLHDKDEARWVRLHGIKVKRYQQDQYAYFPIACTKLKDGKCTIYNKRPDLCRRYYCERISTSRGL